MRSATFINRLIAEGSIERVRVNRYRILDSYRTRELLLSDSVGQEKTLSQVHELYGVETSPGWTRFKTVADLENRPRQVAEFRYLDGHVETLEVDSSHYVVLPGSGIRWYTSSSPESLYNSGFRYYVGSNSRTIFRQKEVLRTITRNSYHGFGSGTSRHGVDAALARIPMDADGVRRSFGLEWEIYSLTPLQEDRLARLLDILPAHFTERDGSLSSSGVEIIFLPLSATEYIDTWTKLQNFCRDTHVDMEGTGAHTTYGVSNSTITDIDQELQVRLSRIALAVKSVSTQQTIKRVFGRDFTGYACLPNERLCRCDHTLAWSASRGNSAYELRLCSWEGNANKIVAFMKATEFIFTRPFVAQDFINIFTIMGSGCSVD